MMIYLAGCEIVPSMGGSELAHICWIYFVLPSLAPADSAGPLLRSLHPLRVPPGAPPRVDAGGDLTVLGAHGGRDRREASQENQQCRTYWGAVGPRVN